MYPREGDLRTDQMMASDEFLAKKSRVVFLSGALGNPYEGNFGGCAIVEDLYAMAKWSKEPITMIINSPGGSINTMLQIYDAIKLLDVPVNTVANFCASAATIIFAAGKKRYLAPNGRTMLHLPSGGMQGDAKEIEIQAKEMERVKELLVDLLIDCGATKAKEEILKDIDRSFWMSAEETIEYGLCDEILTSKELRGMLGAPIKPLGNV